MSITISERPELNSQSSAAAKNYDSCHYSPNFSFPTCAEMHPVLLSRVCNDSGSGPVKGILFSQCQQGGGSKKRGGKTECITALVNEKHMCWQRNALCGELQGVS